jgi:hypothetical protein
VQSAARRLEKLNEIPRRVYQQDLRSAGSRHDVVSELHAGGTQPRHLRGKIVDDQVNAIPAAGPGRVPSGIARPAELVGPLSNRSPVKKLGEVIALAKQEIAEAAGVPVERIKISIDA